MGLIFFPLHGGIRPYSRDGIESKLVSYGSLDSLTEHSSQRGGYVYGLKTLKSRSEKTMSRR